MALHTSSALYLQYAFLPTLLLKCADERGSDGEYGPLPVRGRVRLGPGWRRSVDDILVASGNVGAVARGVEGGHGRGCRGGVKGV